MQLQSEPLDSALVFSELVSKMSNQPMRFFIFELVLKYANF